MAPTVDDYDLDSGFADDVDGTIIEAWFGSKEEYAAIAGTSAPMLNLKIEVPDLERPIDQMYSIGATKLWEARKGGKEVVSGSKPDSHSFHARSRGGELFARMVTLIGEGDRKVGAQFFAQRGYFMTQAETYIGLKFHWKQEERPTLEEGRVSSVLLPVAYLGEVKVEGSPSETVTTASGPAIVETTVSAEDLEKLVELASGKNEKDLKRALVGSELKGNTGLLNMVFNGDLLNTLESHGKLVKDPNGLYI